MIGMQGSNNMLLFGFVPISFGGLGLICKDLQRKPNDLFFLHQLIMIWEKKPEK